MNKIDFTKSAQIIFFVIILSVLSIGLVFAFSFLLEPLKNQWYYPLIDNLGIIGAYILLFSLFDKFFWRHRIFRILSVVSVPYIGGRWKGHIESSYNGRTTKYSAFLEIEQTFSHIKTCLYTEQSFSSSLMADFVIAPNGRQELHYEYHNEPNEKATATMHGHDGVAKFSYKKERNELIGSYYTTSQHDRGNVGSLYFKFESDKTCGCFDNN
ncbi:MAG: hypothetical protein AAB583_00140 [Patescibacteria group bacterium]